MNLSPIIKIDDSVYDTTRFIINTKLLRYIERAVDQIKLPENELDLEVIGFPETISASKEVLLCEVDGNRKVVVKGISIQVPNISIKLELSIDDYKKAIKAQDNITMVRVGCRVKKKVKGWEVIKLNYFNLID